MCRSGLSLRHPSAQDNRGLPFRISFLLMDFGSHSRLFEDDDEEQELNYDAVRRLSSSDSCF